MKKAAADPDRVCAFFEPVDDRFLMFTVPAELTRICRSLDGQTRPLSEVHGMLSAAVQFGALMVREGYILWEFSESLEPTMDRLGGIIACDPMPAPEQRNRLSQTRSEIRAAASKIRQATVTHMAALIRFKEA